VSDEGAAAGRRRPVHPLLALLVIAAGAGLVVALRALFVGHPSFEPVLFAELYVQAFSLLLFIPLLLRAARALRGWEWGAVIAVAVAGSMLLARLAPTIGELNYCGELPDFPAYDIPSELPPKIFRCTVVPFEIAGFLLGWWAALALVSRRRDSRRDPP
jgi:hypothetical protein